MELDEYERPFSHPDLPSWAKPGGGSGQQPGASRPPTEPQNRGARGGTPKSANGGGGKNSEPSSPTANGSTNGNAQSLVREIWGLQASVGEKLSTQVALSVTGTQDIASVTDTGKLALVRESLANVNRGMNRLRKAVEACGLERYSQSARRSDSAVV